MEFDYNTAHENAVIALAMQILESRIRTKTDQFLAPNAITNQFVRCKLQQLEQEVFAVLFLDNQHNLIEYVEMFRGTINTLTVHPREVAKLALQLNTAAVIFAHNHVSGISVPSSADKDTTKLLKDALSLFDIRVLDHVIIGDSTFSFAEAGLI